MGQLVIRNCLAILKAFELIYIILFLGRITPIIYYKGILISRITRVGLGIWFYDSKATASFLGIYFETSPGGSSPFKS